MARVRIKPMSSRIILVQAAVFAVLAAICFSIIFAILIFSNQPNEDKTILQVIFFGAMNVVGLLLIAVLVGSPIALALAMLTFGLLSLQAKLIDNNKVIIGMALSVAMGVILATMYQIALEWPDSNLMLAIVLSSPIAMAVLLKWYQPSEA